MRCERLEPAHQHVEQPLARRLPGDVRIAPRQHLAIDLLHLGRKYGEKRAELGAALGKRQSGTGGDVAERNFLDPPFGQ